MPRRIASFVRRRLSTPPAVSSPEAGPAFVPGESPAAVHHTREVVAGVFLRGEGIEVGALHQPLRVPATVRVKYVDRMTVADLRRQYAELAHEALVEPDIIDNGESLATVGDATQDFVIANHFLEHCQNPIQTIGNLLRVLRPAGILYLAVPDKRFTFDIDRPCTTVEHVMRDYTEGPAWSKRQHLLQIDYSIHFHVWRSAELLELMTAVQRLLAFEVELFLRNGFETIVILRKPG